MKLLAENLNEYILEQNYTINEGLIDDFIQNTDKNVRKNLIKVMIGGMLSIPTGAAILNNIMSDNSIEDKVTEIVNKEDIQPAELVKQLNIIANYVPTALEDEARFLKDIRKSSSKKVSNQDAIKRKLPSHIPSLQEMSSYSLSDKDLKPNKVEIAMKKKGIPGYLNYFNWATNRKYNAPNDGYINLNDIRLSNRGVHNLMKEEAYRNYGYRAESSGAIVTVGFGTAFNPRDYNNHGLQTPYKMGEIVPERKLMVYFYGKLQEFENAVAKAIREGAKRNPNMKYMPQSAVDAVISYSYSTGTGGFRNSKLGKALSSGNIKEAAYWIKNGNKSETGHTNRRNREYEMFTKNFNGKEWVKPTDSKLLSAIDKSPKINIPKKTTNTKQTVKKSTNTKQKQTVKPKNSTASKNVSVNKTQSKISPKKADIKKTNKKITTKNKKGVKK